MATPKEDPSTAEKIGLSGDTQNLEYATPVSKTDSVSSQDPDSVVEEEPELHARTYVAVLALFFLNFVQVYALTGPPAIVGLRCQQVNSNLMTKTVPTFLASVHWNQFERYS